ASDGRGADGEPVHRAAVNCYGRTSMRGRGGQPYRYGARWASRHQRRRVKGGFCPEGAGGQARRGASGVLAVSAGQPSAQYRRIGTMVLPAARAHNSRTVRYSRTIRLAVGRLVGG
ncbi:hypothetical protein, partial [Streptomyces sp. SID12501]|uniref:hypothetical protein n=1 Tax=Streptomyces sp. SID12501 TaxID=2706042 RepID=UPI0019441A5E